MMMVVVVVSGGKNCNNIVIISTFIHIIPIGSACSATGLWSEIALMCVQRL